jgi:WD40 repeat protein
VSPEEDALSLAQLRDDALERGREDVWTAVEASLRARGGSWLRRRHPHTPGTGRLLGVHEGAVTAVALSADGKLAISGSEDGVAKVWSLAAGALLAELRGHEGAIRDIALTPDGAIAITASDDGTLRVWELPGGAERSTLEWHFAGVYSVTIGADARTAESRSHDEHVVVWDLGTGQPLRAAAMSAAAPPRAPASAADVTVTTSPGHELLVHDAAGHVQRALAGHTGRILCTALHSDGRRLVSGGADWTVRAWDTARGAPRVPGTDLSAATLTGDGRLAIAAGADGTLSVWDTATGRLRETLSGERGPRPLLRARPAARTGGPRGRRDSRGDMDLRGADRRARGRPRSPRPFEHRPGDLRGGGPGRPARGDPGHRERDGPAADTPLLLGPRVGRASPWQGV